MNLRSNVRELSGESHYDHGMAASSEPQPPESVLGALRRLSQRVVGLLGADASAWNGAVERIRCSETMVGIAHWEGVLGLREDLLAALERMHVRPGALWDQRSRDEFLQALKTAVHEFTHFAYCTTGGSFGDSAQEYQRWTTRVLEEGATEASTQEWFRLCARDFEAVAPGISTASAVPIYRQFTPAVRVLASYVAGLHGIKPRTVLSMLNQQPPKNKFECLARLVLDANGLWGRIPEDECLDCRDRVVQAIRHVFWRNSDWAREGEREEGPVDAPGRSRIMGMQAVAAVEGARLEVEARYGTPAEVPMAWEVAAARFEVLLAENATDFSRARPAETRAAAADWEASARRRAIILEHPYAIGQARGWAFSQGPGKPEDVRSHRERTARLRRGSGILGRGRPTQAIDGNDEWSR
jgi:hypothetical protein